MEPRRKEYIYFFQWKNIPGKNVKKKGKMMFTFIVRSGNQKFYRQIQIHFPGSDHRIEICIHALNFYMHKKWWKIKMNVSSKNMASFFQFAYIYLEEI